MNNIHCHGQSAFNIIPQDDVCFPVTFKVKNRESAQEYSPCLPWEAQGINMQEEQSSTQSYLTYSPDVLMQPGSPFTLRFF